jgi:energy-coupling factor transporter ATP-binding protein EcfA2
MTKENCFDLNLSGNKDEVLSNLRDMSGRNVKNWIIDSISEPNSLLIVAGRPGAGKTTIINQLLRNTQTPIDVVSFDPIRASLIEELGKNTPFWTADDWASLNNRLIAGVEAVAKKGQNVLLECVGLGVRIKDRGATAAKFPYKVGNKKILAVVPEDISNVIQFRRFIIRTNKFDGLKGLIKDVFRIDMGDEFDDSSESGKKIVEKIMNMGQEQHLLGIDNEVNNILIPDWRKKNPHDARKKLEKVNIKFLTENKITKNLRPEIAYMDYLLESWQFSETDRRVVVNFRLPKEQIIHM